VYTHTHTRKAVSGGPCLLPRTTTALALFFLLNLDKKPHFLDGEGTQNHVFQLHTERCRESQKTDGFLPALVVCKGQLMCQQIPDTQDQITQGPHRSLEGLLSAEETLRSALQTHRPQTERLQASLQLTGWDIQSREGGVACPKLTGTALS
jgi:hypothetical protein